MDKNKKGIFYGVIGVVTLMLAIIGATFAYFTATASGGENEITGNMATITFDLSVTKVSHIDEDKGGMIPMSNTMVEAAVLDTGSGNAAQTCVDDNGNAVCQIYKIVVQNTGSASLFLDGYVTLSGGSGTATDDVSSPTTMRWAQVFCSGNQTDYITGCTTVGKTTTGAGVAVGGEQQISVGVVDNWESLANTSDTTGFSRNYIKKDFSGASGITVKGAIAGSNYDIINRNFIRISNHASGGYTRTGDITSALVFNQFLTPAGSQTGSSVTYYIVVWLSETGHNQTAGAAGAFANANGLDFFDGVVTFNSAQGSEVTATFSSFVAVESDQV